MKALICTVFLFLTACGPCTRVSTTVEVMGKSMEPERTGICMAIYVNKIPSYVPVQGGICAGIIEIIPARYHVQYSDGAVQDVTQEQYDQTKIGDRVVETHTECK